MKITLEKAEALLEECAGVQIDGNLVSFSMSDLEGQEDNQWLHLSWEDEFDEFSISFDERANPRIAKGELILTDTEGEDVALTLLRVWELV